MRSRIRVLIKVKGWILIRIRIKVKSWIRIRIKVMWIRTEPLGGTRTIKMETFLACRLLIKHILWFIPIFSVLSSVQISFVFTLSVTHFCSQALCVALFAVLRISDTFIRDADISKVLNQVLLQFSTRYESQIFQDINRRFLLISKIYLQPHLFLMYRHESTSTVFQHFILFL
jgi:hypothetical protein